MDLGEYYPCLNVRDLDASIAFYLKLDFTIVEDHREERWAVLQHNNMALCLFQGHIDENLINFRGGDIEAVHDELVSRGVEIEKPAVREADGSWSAEVRDPDGNSIYFNTFPDERETYVRTGQLIEYPLDAETLPDFNALWNFNDPAATEQSFRDLLPRARRAGGTAYEAEILTQIARTQGLQQRFDDAHATLGEADALIQPGMDRAKVRSLLERGRAINSSGDPEAAQPVFEQALDEAIDAGLEYYAVDAAHMLGIVCPGDESVAWNERALEIAEAAEDERARRWRGALYNNLGWTYHELGRHEDALVMFEKHLEVQTEQGNQEMIGIAMWSIAKTYRFLGRADEALEMQEQILERPERQGNDSEGYTREEIGECLLVLGREDEAAEHFARAWALLRDDPWLQRDEAERLERLKRLGQV